LGNALRSTNEVVNKGANQLRENDYHNPNNLVVSMTRLFRRALHEHPNPENQGGDNEKEKEQYEAAVSHSQPPNLKVPIQFGGFRNFRRDCIPHVLEYFPVQACRKLFSSTSPACVKHLA
jgi:hypothetical protein